MPDKVVDTVEQEPITHGPCVTLSAQPVKMFDVQRRRSDEKCGFAYSQIVDFDHRVQVPVTTLSVLIVKLTSGEVRAIGVHLESIIRDLREGRIISLRELPIGEGLAHERVPLLFDLDYSLYPQPGYSRLPPQ